MKVGGVDGRECWAVEGRGGLRSSALASVHLRHWEYVSESQSTARRSELRGDLGVLRPPLKDVGIDAGLLS